MTDDAELLRSYATEHAEAAFAELVRRHVGFVYACALRQANGDVHLAQDATQSVFTDLARKAPELSRHAVLKGWLFTSTRFAVSKLIRGERRRRAREEEARMQDEIDRDSSAAVEWERVRPMLDEALAELKEADRQAVLLRYFEGCDFAAVGARLRLSENAARMRVTRALDQLHAQLARRGWTSTTAALSTLLLHFPLQAAPAGLAATVTTGALAGAGVTTAAAGWLAFMSMNKLTTGIGAALLLGGAAGMVAQAKAGRELHAQLATLRAENEAVPALQAENLRLEKTAAEVAAMRGDDAAMAQLDSEAESLRKRIVAADRAIARAPVAAKPFEVRLLDQVPVPRSQARPVYPATLRAVGTEGEVVVDFIVDSSGKVVNAYALKSSLRDFEDPAVAAISQWTFAPGKKGGRAVNTHLQVPIVFKMAPQPAATTGGLRVIEKPVVAGDAADAGHSSP